MAQIMQLLGVRVEYLEDVVFKGNEALTVRTKSLEDSKEWTTSTLTWILRLAITTALSVIGCLLVLIYQLISHGGAR